MRLKLQLSDTPSLAQAWKQRVQVHTVAQVRTSLLGHLLLAVDEGLGWSAEGTEVVVLCEWGDWLQNSHALLVIAQAHASSSSSSSSSSSLNTTTSSSSSSAPWSGSTGEISTAAASGGKNTKSQMASGGCLMTYGTAVEYPTGRVHRHVQALTHAALRHNTVRFRSSWNLGPPYSFRLALLRAIHRSDLSTEASPGIAQIHALHRTSRALPEHTRLGGTHTGDEEGSVQDSVPRDQGQELKALGEPYWEVGLALPLIKPKR